MSCRKSGPLSAWLRRSATHRLALHRSGQTYPERLHRELQRPAQGRTAQRDAVRLAPARAEERSVMAGWLQPQPPALTARLADPGRIRQHLQPATGPGAALNARLRTSPRRSPRPDRPNQTPESPSRWIKVGATSPSA